MKRKNKNHIHRKSAPARATLLAGSFPTATVSLQANANTILGEIIDTLEHSRESLNRSIECLTLLHEVTILHENNRKLETRTQYTV